VIKFAAGEEVPDLHPYTLQAPEAAVREIARIAKAMLMGVNPPPEGTTYSRAAAIAEAEHDALTVVYPLGMPKGSDAHLAMVFLGVLLIRRGGIRAVLEALSPPDPLTPFERICVSALAALLRGQLGP
jgi:hypothetical protein